MKIKSLLLGSAAALLAVSGARAADAVVVAEPEPMEYVRICDVYGAGFYYIPGTETCLKIGGVIRHQIDWSDETNGGWNKKAAARLNLDARSETEYGTFKRFIEMQASVHQDSEDLKVFSLRYAYFELGGLMVGRNDTLFEGDLSGEFDSGGGSFINSIRYTFDAGNGITGSVGLEEENSGHNYVPLTTGNVSIAQGWGSVNLYSAYDNLYSEFAMKGIAKVKTNDALTLELLAAYESGPTWMSLGYDAGDYSGYDFSLGGYLKYKVNGKLAVGAGGQYFAGYHDVLNDTKKNNWAVGAVVDYTVVENLKAKLALNYKGVDPKSYKNSNEDATFGALKGFLRLDASF